MVRKYILIILIPLGLFGSALSLAAQDVQEVKLSDSLIQELHYLLSFVGQEAEPPERFQPEQIENIIGFVSAPQKSNVRYNAGEFNGATSAYHAFDIRRSLADVIRLAYSPDIHPVTTAPSSIRTSRWIRINTPDGKLPLLWEEITDLKTPQIVTGVEYIVNSPDTHSGAYYEYDLDRTLISMRYKGENIFISLSKQRGTSGVGKKGLIVGDDSQWDYIYSDETGLTKPGLGWVRSYMYDSYSVNIYREFSAKPRWVRFAAFKWIRAGWADINLVRSHHIYDGMNRFATAFKNILESPRASNATHFEQTFASIKQLPDDALRQIVREHMARIESQCISEGLLSKQQVEELFENDRYLNGLDRDEMEAIVALEKIKQLLGKNQQTKITYLPINSNPVE